MITHSQDKKTSELPVKHHKFESSMEGCADDEHESPPRNSTVKKVLEPFGHQVGGRCLVLTYDDETVCKELVPQEYRFYRHLPPALLPFTPGFKGIVKVEFHPNKEGVIQVMAHAPESGLSISESGENLDYTACDDEKLLSAEQVQEEERDRNPWSLHCQCLQLQKLQTSDENRTLHDFILLENVVSNFSCPNILDLKMGNKTHNDYQCDKKQERQRARMDSSTSKSLGVRIAGVQLYEPVANKFKYHDKYYGFQLSPEGFKQALKGFLHNGHKLRDDVIQPFICKLSDLHACLSLQDSSRFYSSSLLLSYDGLEDQNGNFHNLAPGQVPLESEQSVCSCSHSHTSRVEVRMIDFEHCFHGLSHKGFEKKGPDKGYLFGLESLLQLFKEIQSNS